MNFSTHALNFVKVSGQRTEGDLHFNTAGVTLNGMNLKEENEISVSLKRWTKVEAVFHFFHFFFHVFPNLSNQEENDWRWE